MFRLLVSLLYVIRTIKWLLELRLALLLTIEYLHLSLVLCTLQCLLHLSIRECAQIEVSGRIFTEPIKKQVNPLSIFSSHEHKTNTYHATCTSDTVRIYGRVVNTNSLKITQSG